MSPKWVATQFDASSRAELLELISANAEQCLKVIAAIKRERGRDKDSVIRNVLLDLEATPPIWTLPDAAVADLVCKGQKRKRVGSDLLRLIANVKKQRQLLAKAFPKTKGKC